MIRGFAPPWAVEVAKQVTPPTEQLRGVWLMSEPGRAKVAEEALFEEQCLKMTLYIVTDIKLYKHVHYTKDPSSCLYFEPVVNKQARRKISASSEVLLKSIRSVTLSKDGISVSLVLPDHHDLATHKARAAATADEGSEPPPFNKMRVYVDDRRGFVAEVEGRGPKPPVGGGIDR